MATEIMGHYFNSVNYSYRNIYHFSVNGSDMPGNQFEETLRRMRNELSGWPEVETIALTTNTVPFLEAGNRDERVQYQGFVSRAQRWEVDENFCRLLKLPLLSGKWFSGQEVASLQVPIVITKAMSEEYFVNKNPLGNLIQINEKQYKVVGVVDNFNVGKWTYSQSGYFLPADLSSNLQVPHHFLVKFKKEIHAHEYEKLSKFFSHIQKNERLTVGQGATLQQYNTLEKRSAVLPVTLISVVCGFLIINVIIGLFGILWQSIRYRRAEFGLRRAIGAEAGDIYLQILGEVLILATFGIIPSAIIAFHFPLLHFLGFEMQHSVYVMLCSALLIYVLVGLCALYPSKLAASIAPAEALHEN
jgi:putative ABC transport system permease protein